MNLRIVTGPHGRTREIDLTGPHLLLASVLIVGIFIAGLAFPDPRMLAAAKLAVLIASAGAGVLALLVGRLLLPAAPAIASVSVDEAESSTVE